MQNATLPSCLPICNASSEQCFIQVAATTAAHGGMHCQPTCTCTWSCCYGLRGPTYLQYFKCGEKKGWNSSSKLFFKSKAWRAPRTYHVGDEGATNVISVPSRPHCQQTRSRLKSCSSKNWAHVHTHPSPLSLFTLFKFRVILQDSGQW